MNIEDRFLTYINFDTQSNSSSKSSPSTLKQLNLAKYLVEELKSLGITNAEMDEFGYVYAHIPASPNNSNPTLALIAHMDTAPEMSGTNINPKIIRNYDGSDIVLNEEKNIVTKVSSFPVLNQFKGENLIVTDGLTLLGADDKAGICEIMTLVDFLTQHPDYPHPKIAILFTPDEEIGRGTDHVNLEKLNASYGYTIDGGLLGEFSYENFNAANAKVIVHGISSHPGYAKGILKNSLLIAMEYQQLLPIHEIPSCTENREGFYHLNQINGNVETTFLEYSIRDHDYSLFCNRIEVMKNAANYINQKYGSNTIELDISESYFNMYEQVKNHTFLIDHVLSAMKDASVNPIIAPIRGGTDGSRLSYLGLPCPNICTGGQNGHGRHEFISIQSMEKVVEILKNLVSHF